MDVYLIRHAAAQDRDETDWPDDALRPLTKSGKKEFRKAARGLRRLVGRVDLVLSSPFSRAWQTAQILRDEARWPKPTAQPALGADAPVAGYRETFGESTAKSVALVGHEPGLSHFAAQLLLGEDAAAFFDLDKGGVACLRIEPGEAQDRARLLWLADQKSLSAGAPGKRG